MAVQLDSDGGGSGTATVNDDRPTRRDFLEADPATNEAIGPTTQFVRASGASAPARTGPGDEPTAQERAAGARAARVKSGGIPTADEVAEETERVQDETEVDASGQPRTTRVSAGATSVTVTNIKGTDESTPGDDAPEGSTEPDMAERVTRAISGPGGDDAPNTDGSRVPPSPGGGIAEGEILPGVHVPRVQLPDRSDVERFAEILQLAAGAIVAGIVLWLLGNLFDVQVGGSSS